MMKDKISVAESLIGILKSDISLEDARRERLEEKYFGSAEREAWHFAKGIVQMDGVAPSTEMHELAEKECRGEMSTDDIREYLRQKYSKK